MLSQSATYRQKAEPSERVAIITLLTGWHDRRFRLHGQPELLDEPDDWDTDEECEP
jgi:hypothetical protein